MTVQDEMMQLLSNPMDLPPVFWDYMIQRWLADAPVFPATQVFGFLQFTAIVAPPIATAETRATSTFGDLATVGPTLTGLPDGNYLLAFGAGAAGSPGVSNALMSAQVNATPVAAGEYTYTSSASATSVMRILAKPLNNGGANTVTAKYASSNNAFSCTWADRWMLVLKYSNL